MESSVASGIQGSNRNVLYYILMATCTGKKIIFCKGQVISTQKPSNIMLATKQSTKKKFESSKNSRKPNKGLRRDRNRDSGTSILDVDAHFHDSIRTMLASFACIRSRKFKRFDAVKHCFKSTQDSRPFCSAPYCARPKTHKLEEQKSEKQPDADVIIPTTFQ